jgi:3-hydroxyisobutyrate dehydrogenase-like beta-hydroxyacid dehydrogenase
MTMSSIGFVGLGSMGAPIAGRLLEGHQVSGTNRTKEKATGLIERGLIWRDTPREVAAAAPVAAQGQMAAASPGQQARDAA